MQTVAIVGLGLIGGSFGLALREAGFSGRVLGVGAPPFAAQALERGAITESASLPDAARAADLLYLAEPVDVILQVLRELSGLVGPATLVTDCGSTKRSISGHAARFLPPDSFLGGHPLAGKEQRGIQAAEASLFRDRPYVLTHRTASPIEQDFRAWLTRIGAQVLHLTPEEHDRAVAFTSHLPQLLSTALALSLSQHQNPQLTSVFGPGLLDMTRLALSSGDLWSSILTTNADEVAKAIQEFVVTLKNLQSECENALADESFRQASSFASSLRRLQKFNVPRT